MLLHGFPEFWYAWRYQIPTLADAGYRVVAPDLPGYNTSDKPRRVRDYQPRVLAQEVADLIVALGAGSAVVAGHDWGGELAWLLAMHHPERVERLVVLNAPHPVRFLKGLRSPASCGAAGTSSPSSSPGRPNDSWRPGTSRRCAGPCDANRPGRVPSRSRTSTATSPPPPSQAPCAPPFSVQAIIQLLPYHSNYYRAAFRANPLAQVHSLRRVDIPTLIIWGEHDRYLGRELAQPDQRLGPGRAGRADH